MPRNLSETGYLSYGWTLPFETKRRHSVSNSGKMLPATGQPLVSGEWDINPADLSESPGSGFLAVVPDNALCERLLQRWPTSFRANAVTLHKTHRHSYKNEPGNEHVAGIARTIPAGRLGRPRRVAQSVRCSIDCSGTITNSRTTSSATGC